MTVYRVKGMQSSREPWGAQTVAFKGPLIPTRHRFSKEPQFTRDTIRRLCEKGIGWHREAGRGQRVLSASGVLCSDMASDVEITDPEEVRLTAPVKGTNTGWLWLLDVLSNLTRKEPIICTGWGERRSGAGIYAIGKNRASQKWRH